MVFPYPISTLQAQDCRVEKYEACEKKPFPKNSWFGNCISLICCHVKFTRCSVDKALSVFAMKMRYSICHYAQKLSEETYACMIQNEVVVSRGYFLHACIHHKKSDHCFQGTLFQIHTTVLKRQMTQKLPYSIPWFQKAQNLCPISVHKESKTIIFWAKYTYMNYLRECPFPKAPFLQDTLLV